MDKDTSSSSSTATASDSVRRSSRVVRAPVGYGTQGAAAGEKLLEWYQNFSASESSSPASDTSGSTSVTLQWLDMRDGNRGDIHGQTGSSHGHAEMDALHQFVTQVNNDHRQPFVLELGCEAKPCCIRCSAVMGLLGVHHTDRTKKCTSTMLAGGAWGVSAEVRAFLQSVSGKGGEFWDEFSRMSIR